MTELHEPVGGIGIVVLSADTLHLPLSGYLPAEEGEDALADRQLAYLPGDVVNGIRDARSILFADDAQHLMHLPIHLRPDEQQVGLPVVAVADDDCRLPVVPLAGEDMVAGTDPAQTALMDEMVIQCAFLSRHGGCSEFYFYCCHNSFFLNLFNLRPNIYSGDYFPLVSGSSTNLVFNLNIRGCFFRTRIARI